MAKTRKNSMGLKISDDMREALDRLASHTGLTRARLIIIGVEKLLRDVDEKGQLNLIVDGMKCNLKSDFKIYGEKKPSPSKSQAA